MNNLKKIIKSFEKRFDDLLVKQQTKKLKEGCYVYELEADTTISEYIMLMHYSGEIDIELQNKIINYILSKQNNEGGWPLFFKGDSDLSASVKAYYALKLSGLNEKSSKMIKAKNFIIQNGWHRKGECFYENFFAIFGQITWSSIPYMPIEIMKFPNGFL